MPTYNKVQFIARAIESVRGQTLRDWELIIVDDCSTDGTQELLEHYRELDERIKVIYRKKNYGIAVSRNLACKASSSGLILVLDADDWADKCRARVTYNYFKKHPDTDLFYGSFMLAEPDGKCSYLVGATPIDKNILKETGYFEICHSTVAYPKRIWEKYPYKGTGEWDLYWGIYSNSGKIRFTRKTLGAFRCSERCDKDYGKFKHHLEKKKKKMGLQCIRGKTRHILR